MDVNCTTGLNVSAWSIPVFLGEPSCNQLTLKVFDSASDPFAWNQFLCMQWTHTYLWWLYSLCVCTCEQVSMYNMHMCVHACMHVCVSMHACMACICVCMHVCMCMCDMCASMHASMHPCLCLCVSVWVSVCTIFLPINAQSPINVHSLINAQGKMGFKK